MFGAACLVPSHAGTQGETLDFNRDIRPILSKCLACHGNDPGALMAGLKLDDAKIATTKLESGKTAIVPFHPEKSELVRRIEAKDESERMPPAESKQTLSREERETLKRWIAEGARYQAHWAFVAPRRPAAPKVKLASWPRTPLDRFILARLESKGLKPSPEADRRTLIRRVTLDLTGLPPALEEIDAFLADKDPNAYEKVVDRLLASPRYGERMAMDWMDYSRYADSNGYQADYERFQWRWRDWVIEAFNKNMPYDRFTVEQLAGDLLPNPTLEQRLATGFNRNHRINTEGGVIVEEWRVETVVDRVETTSAIWLGLTAGCARCHDHKYDPITQKEFYGLYAYFNQVPETGSGEERPVNHPPLMKAPYPEQARRIKQLTSRLSQIDSELATRTKANDGKFVGWRPNEATPLASLKDGLAVRYRLGATSVVAAGSGPAPRNEGTPGGDVGRSTGAVRTDPKSYVDLGDVGAFDSDRPYSVALWMRPEAQTGIALSRMDVQNSYRGWDVQVYDRRLSAHLISKWPENAIKVSAKEPVVLNRWTHVAVTYDGSKKAAGLKIYVDGKPSEMVVDNDNLTASTLAQVSAKVGRRTMTEPFTGLIDDVALYSRTLAPGEVANMAAVHPAKTLASIPAEALTPAQRQELNHLWSLENDSTYAALEKEKVDKAGERGRIESEVSTVMVMEEVPDMRPTRVLIRGAYDKPGERVKAGVPAALPPLPKGAPSNRLGLARWIVSEQNPLTARVTVNRMWERLFGTGIVPTTEDFGTRAEYPSHPELLDWLATELVRQKWNLKEMWKTLVMSATYRQSSNVTPNLLKADPENRLLARGPRFRLPAEVLRDQALSFGGLLFNKLGGPSVRPYQPNGIWDETNVYGNLRNYMHDKGPGLHRRSLYTIWKRTAAPPNMTLFDVPSREFCRMRRARTNTPLQALTLLNDVTYLEAARGLAQRMLREGGKSPESRLALGFRVVLSRAPGSDEARILLGGLASRILHYRKFPQAAAALLKQGDSPIDPKLDPAELAAYTIAASTLLNLDEAVTKE